MSDFLTPNLSSHSGLSALNDDKLFSLEQSVKSRETPEELKKVAKEFESIFMQQVFSAMDKTVDRSNSLVSGGPGEDTFRDMLYESIASDMSKPNSPGMGLADAIYKQLIVGLPKSPQDPSNAQAITPQNGIPLQATRPSIPIEGAPHNE